MTVQTNKLIAECNYETKVYFEMLNRIMKHRIAFNSYHKTFNSITNTLDKLTKGKCTPEVKSLVHQAARAYREGQPTFPVCLHKPIYTEVNKTKSKGSKLQYTKMRLLLNTLESSGFGTLFLGGTVMTTQHINLQSCFEASDSFWDMFKGKDVKLTPPRTSEYKPQKDTIKCKARSATKKTDFDLITPTNIAELRKTEHEINEFLRGYKFTLPTGKNNTMMVFPSDYHRVFTTLRGNEKNVLDCSGRHYNKITSVDNEIRGMLHINGIQTMVVDFTAMHTFAAYDYYGKEWKGLESLTEGSKPDAYKIDTSFIKGSDRVKRTLVKMAAQMLFNAKNPAQALQKDIVMKLNVLQDWKDKEGTDKEFKLNYKIEPLLELEELPTYNDYKAIVTALRESHKSIFDLPEMGGEQSAKFQNFDARIATLIMSACVTVNIPFQCQHDGFHIFPRDEAVFLGLMKSAWKHILGSTKHCHISKTYY